MSALGCERPFSPGGGLGDEGLIYNYTSASSLLPSSSHPAPTLVVLHNTHRHLKYLYIHVLTYYLNAPPPTRMSAPQREDFFGSGGSFFCSMLGP